METANPLEHRVRRRLAEWEAAGLLRVLRPPAGLDFSSNDYLNLSTHPTIVDRLARAVSREGCGSTGSRLLRGDRALFGAVERRFADFKRAERSLYFSSGYLANISVITTIAERGDTIGLGAVLTREPSLVAASAMTDSDLLRFGARQFWQLATDSPDLLRALTAGIATMLLDAHPDAFTS